MDDHRHQNFDPESGEILPPTTLEDDASDDADGNFAGTMDEDGPGMDDFEPVKDEEITLETLSGDIRDVLLSRFRTARRPWEQMVEQERRDLTGAFDLAARDLVRKVVRLATGFEFPRVPVVLGQVNIKGGKGIEAKITCPNVSTSRDVLGGHVGDMVLMLMVDSERFMAERKPIDIPPDQAGLPLNESATAEGETF